MSGLHPIGPELVRLNRRRFAEHGDWPAGALAECERLERIYPEWYPMWMPASDWNDRPAGYYATRDRSVLVDGRPQHQTEVYGATPEELEAAIEAAPPPWKLDLRHIL